MAFCTECGARLPDGAKFCANCGAAVAVSHATNENIYNRPIQTSQEKVLKCPSCHSPISRVDAVCPYCGAPIQRRFCKNADKGSFICCADSWGKCRFRLDYDKTKAKLADAHLSMPDYLTKA